MLEGDDDGNRGIYADSCDWSELSDRQKTILTRIGYDSDSYYQDQVLVTFTQDQVEQLRDAGFSQAWINSHNRNAGDVDCMLEGDDDGNRGIYADSCDWSELSDRQKTILRRIGYDSDSYYQDQVLVTFTQDQVEQLRVAGFSEAWINSHNRNAGGVDCMLEGDDDGNRGIYADSCDWSELSDRQKTILIRIGYDSDSYYQDQVLVTFTQDQVEQLRDAGFSEA